MKRFEIKCGVIRKIGVVKRKDGSRSIELRGEIPGTHDNLLNFCKKIGYRYCKERSQLAAYALEYLLMIKEMEKEERKIRKKIIFLKSRGLSLTKIALKLNLTKKYVDYILYNKNKNANKLRVVSKLSSFDEWLNERIGNPHDGVIWENVKQIKPMGKKNVMDLEVVKDHNFIVNGFLTHNCQTALSGYEVTDSYEDVKDPNIYVKFQIAGKDNEYIVISTTTPWTLVSNVAIAVHPDEYYVKVKVGKEKLIISEKRIDAVLKELVKVDYEIEEKFLGKELAGLKYLPVLDVPIQEKLKSEENAHRIILSIPVLKSKSYKHGILEKYEKMKTEFFDFVNAEEGSGCVHVAPGHGPEDYYVGQHYNLPSISPIDDEGRFDTEAGEFRGMFVKEADKKVVEKLEKKNRLLYFTWVIHSYPLCWRCKSPLIFRLTKQWFLSVDLIKEKMIKESENVKWLPDFGKERFRNWLNEAVDWCISRQRYWGIPMPIWICEKCEKIEVIGSVEELRSKAKEKLPKKLNLHKHVIDKIRLVCSNCNSDMVKVPDILDVWFDSGISPWASLGYPFRNKEVFEYLWPVDLIDESQDQIRGWFYSLIFCGVSIFNESPFKTVCMNGWVLDEKGEKMSKSLGNVIWASDAIENLGSDILRFYFCWEVAPWEQQNFSFKIAEEVRKIFNILWSCYSFFLLYSSEFEFEEDNLRVEDKWILSKINSLIKEVENNLENFEFHLAGRKIGNFILNDLSRFYIKLIRDRVWVSKKDEDKKVALTCLYKVLMSLAKILSPISPFISEEVYQNMKKFGNEKKDSVHLCAWPSHNEKLIDKDLEDKMEKVKKIIEACYSLRQREKIKLRWPVKRIFIWSEKE
ncbi:MAG: isoleucine--tRNA ligase, partial [Candidatus Aenigmatarchaeota archaeon]